MFASVLYEYGNPDALKYVEDFPEPAIADDEVLIAAAAASINPIDYKMRSGAAKNLFPVQFPAILGRDVSGTVQRVGSRVNGFEVGQPVMALAMGTYAQFVKVKAADLTHIPDGVDVINAAAIPLVSLTGAQVIQACDLKEGQTVLVTGALGSVGRCAVHAAKKRKARVVAGVRKSQVEEARTLRQADSVIALDDDSSIAQLQMLDAVADMVGGESGARLLPLLRPGGVFGSVLGPPQGADKYPHVRIAPIMAHPDPSKVREFADDIRDGNFVLPIDRSFPLREAGEAQQYAEDHARGKVLLLML